MVKGSIAALALGFAFVTNAEAGCLSGAAAGGVVGHVAGHHGLAGAAVGCAIGHHSAKVKDKQASQPAQGSQSGQSQNH